MTAYELRSSDWSSDVCASDLVFGEWQTGRHRATENPAGVAVAFAHFKALLTEELEYLQKVRPLLHHVNGTGAIGQLAQATWVRGEGNDLHQDCQAFLGHRGRGWEIGRAHV